jgi:hypothetical protein
MQIFCLLCSNYSKLIAYRKLIAWINFNFLVLTMSECVTKENNVGMSSLIAQVVTYIGYNDCHQKKIHLFTMCGSIYGLLQLKKDYTVELFLYIL